jgi:hypothetical protein
MPAPKGKGIADDAADYEDLGSSRPAPRASAPPKKQGIAEDAEAFADLVDETTDKARTLESDWLYQKNGQVFGPLKPRELLELLYSGEIDADTPIAVSDGEFAALQRYGVFRVHLPKVEKRRIERQAAQIADEAAAKAAMKRRIVWATAAICLAAAGTYGLVQFIRSRKAEAARLEARAKEALLKEVESLMASVTIEPPLIDLGEDDAEKSTGAKRRSKRAVARFSGGSGVIGEGGTGELTRQEIMTGIGRSFQGIKRCIVEQIQRDADTVPEQIVLTFSINNDGLFQNISFTDRTLRGSPMRDCFARTLGEIRYRKFKGEVQNVEYPITIGRQ